MRFWGLAALCTCLGVLAMPGEVAAVAGSCPEVARQDSSAVWRPDGRAIAFVRLHANECVVAGGIQGEARWSVATAAQNGGQIRELVSRVDSPLSVAWSPDGAQLVVISFHRTWIVRAEDGSVTLDRPIGSGSIGGLPPVWSRDSRRVAVWDNILDASSGVVTALGVTFNAQPSWSPDGTKLAALANDGLEVIDLRGDRQWIGPGGSAGGSVSWSDDGQWIAYEALTGLRVIHPDGTDLRTFPELRGTVLGWQRDRIEVFSGTAVQLVTLDGRIANQTRLPHFYPDGGLPDFLPGGGIVYGGTDLCPRLGIFREPGMRVTNNCVITGTRRADKITGTPLPDAILAKAGNDFIRTRDLNVDLINCGLGRDTAIVDTNDIVRACERVLRRPYP